jgi:hypothetical protein
MPSSPQFYAALNALTKKNTTNFNTQYATEGMSPKSKMIKVPSQFNIAKLSIERGSPIPFNEAYGYSNRRKAHRRSTRKNRKARRSTRRARK